MKKSYIIIGVVVVLMLAAAGIYAKINKASATTKKNENVENSIEQDNNVSQGSNNEKGE